MSLLSEEIHSERDALDRLLTRHVETAAKIAGAISGRGVSYVIIAARGTSDNVARYAKYLFGSLDGLPVGLAAPSLFSIYHTPPRFRDALVLGISQSGESPDIVAVVEEGRQQGMVTVAITNEPGSPLAAAAEYVLPLEAGPERAVAATKTYVNQLAALALLAVQLAGDEERLSLLRAVPEAVGKTLALDGRIAEIAQRYVYATEAVVLGRGYNYGTAFEIALKLEELTYMVVEPYSSADFRHGPMAIIDRGFPAIVVSPQGAVYSDIVALTRELASRGAEIVAISGQDQVLDMASMALRLPVVLPEWLSPFTCVVPGQLLAMHIAHAKGYDVDHPRGLRKVTMTR